MKSSQDLSYLFQSLSLVLAPQISIKWTSLMLMTHLSLVESITNTCLEILFSSCLSEKLRMTHTVSQKKFWLKFQTNSSAILLPETSNQTQRSPKLQP